MDNIARHRSGGVTIHLLKEMRDGAYRSVKMLPPEMELAERYNVSRNIIRECLTRLEREGYITRKHGVGTVINKSVVNVGTRLDLNSGLLQSIEDNGKHAEQFFRRCDHIVCGANIKEKLHLKEDESVLRVEWLLTADGKPAVFCEDYIPEKLIEDKSYTEKDFEGKTIFDFLKVFCNGRVIETCLAELRAMPPTEEAAEALEVPMTSGLLHLEEVAYDFRATPILYCKEYFIDRMIRHMIVRKKI